MLLEDTPSWACSRLLQDSTFWLSGRDEVSPVRLLQSFWSDFLAGLVLGLQT